MRSATLFTALGRPLATLRDLDAAGRLCNPEHMPLFAVVRTQGPAWQPDTGLAGQPEWREHADFMNALEAEGLVVLGGPLDGTPDVLLVMRADSAETIRQRLDQ